MDPSTPEATSEVEALREQVARLIQEREQWLEEKARLLEDNENLKKRCEKLARAGAKAGDRLPPLIDQMLRSPKDEAVQLQGIEALFAQQTRAVDGTQGDTSATALQGSLEAAVAIFGNHPGNHMLLLKVSQFLSVLLAEPNAQQQLPLAVLFQAAQAVMSSSIQLLADVAATSLPEGLAAPAKDGSPSPAKIMTWFLSLLTLLLPCLGARLRVKEQGETFINDLFCKLVGRLLASPELPQEAIMLKCVQLLPLLPTEPWIQKACLESHAVHNLALAYHRCRGGSVRCEPETALPKAIHMAVRGVFTDNMEICVKAMSDTFVSDGFICLEVLDELRGMEKKQRGAFRALDSEWGILGKALDLWNFHQRRALEDPDPQRSMSREVLQKVAELLNAVLLKLPPQLLLQRMQEFRDAEVVQRIAMAAVHTNAQLRLQVAVNYVENGVIPVVIACLQMFLRHYEGAAPTPQAPSAGIEAAFRLLRDGQLPAEAWPYVLYGLEVILHVLSHWSATKISLGHKVEMLDSRAAPLLLAQGGLPDVLAEIIDPSAAGFELHTQPPTNVLQKASETLQALFEQNGHICLFCMQHFTEVKQMTSLGCDSIAMDPLTDFPELQQQAVTQLVASFDKFSGSSERLGRKILKALAVLFESSYRLVAWFLNHHRLIEVGDYQSFDVHIEAIRALSRAPYWSAEDAPLLPEFVALLAELLLRSIEGHGDDSASLAAASKPPRRVFDLTEAQEVVAACLTSVLHLLLIDPSPPTVLHSLSRSLSQYGKADAWPQPEEEGSGVGSEQAVNAVMKVMQVFPSSDHVQLNCQHLLTSLLGE